MNNQPIDIMTSSNDIIFMPTDMIIQIASYMNESICKTLNRDIYNGLILEENSEVWKQLYMNKIKTISNLPAIKNTISWKMEYCRVIGKDYLDIISRLKKLDERSSINLNSKNIHNIPKELFCLSNLQQFSMSDNEIEIIPKEIENLINLENFEVDNNKIKKIPEKIGHLKSLITLILNHNFIKVIPKEIVNLTNLKELDIGHNEIKVLPIELCKLDGLHNLECWSNQITKIPYEIGNLKKLKVLNLSSNFLVDMDFEIGDLVSLKELYINNNALCHFPIGIGDLKKLSILDMSFNQIGINIMDGTSPISTYICKLKGLKYLYLNRNKIKELPIELNYLGDITIDMGNNLLDFKKYNISNYPHIYF